MKRYFMFLMLFSCMLPYSTGAAADVFQSEGSFTLAKVTKLGRSKSLYVGATPSIHKNMPGPELLEECNDYCASCDRTTGTCLRCDNGRYLKNNYCLSCFENALCDGVKASCEVGYKLDGDSCTEVACDPWKPETGGHYWNANGSHSIPSKDVRCWHGYGAYATISVPNASYNSVGIRFHQGASVSGSFSTKQLSIINGTSATKAGDVTFSSPVTVTEYVHLAKGRTATFNGGLRGSPACKVEGGDGTCTCTTSKCSMDEEVACNPWDPETGGHYWNANGSHSVPSGNEIRCWHGYGASASISIPSNTYYTSSSLRFHQGATVSGAFTTGQLHITNGGSATKAGDVTFNDPVTVNEFVRLAKGRTATFKGGLKGSPSCQVEGDGTCTCTTSKCYTN